MDPTLVSQIGSVTILLGGLGWLSRQYSSMGKRLDASAKACADRELALNQRLQSLETSRNTDLMAVVNAAMESMKVASNALHENSGTFRIMADRKPPKQGKAS